MNHLIVVDRNRSYAYGSVHNFLDLSMLKQGGFICFDPSREDGVPYNDNEPINTDFCIAYGAEDWAVDGPTVINIEIKDLTVTKAIATKGESARISVNKSDFPTIDEACNITLKLYNRKTINKTKEDVYTVYQYSKDGSVDIKALGLELQRKIYGGDQEHDRTKWDDFWDKQKTIKISQHLIDITGLDVGVTTPVDENKIDIVGKAGEQWVVDYIVTGVGNKVLFSKHYAAEEVRDGIGTPEYMFELYKKCSGNRGFTETDTEGKSLYPGYIKSIEDVKALWFYKDNIYNIFTLRFRNSRKSAKTRDEEVWQYIHLAYPQDKEPTWPWVRTLFSNFIK